MLILSLGQVGIEGCQGRVGSGVWDRDGSGDHSGMRVGFGVKMEVGFGVRVAFRMEEGFSVGLESRAGSGWGWDRDGDESGVRGGDGSGVWAEDGAGLSFPSSMLSLCTGW